eukprot:scaffold55490_cov61-Cyclotella_meneghiniana.AAC.13
MRCEGRIKKFREGPSEQPALPWVAVAVEIVASPTTPVNVKVICEFDLMIRAFAGSFSLFVGVILAMARNGFQRACFKFHRETFGSQGNWYKYQAYIGDSST